MIDYFTEIEFIHKLNLRNLRQEGRNFRFSCPLCNEGKSPWKRRGYYLFDNGTRGHNTFCCQNGCEPRSLKTLIRDLDYELYKQYCRVEKDELVKELKSGRSIFKKRTIAKFTEGSSEPKYVFKLSPRTFTPARKIPKAVEYCRSRKFPDAIIDTLFFGTKKNTDFYNMLIFPLSYDEESVTGFQGRTIEGKKRFQTFTKNDSFKVYNFFNVDSDRNVYVLEAIIDSFFIDNAIAMLGSDLSVTVRKTLKHPIFCFDNDRTGWEKSLKYLNQNERVFIWPDQLQSKDFNELICKGVTPPQIKKMVDENIFSGPQGIARVMLKLGRLKRGR